MSANTKKGLKSLSALADRLGQRTPLREAALFLRLMGTNAALLPMKQVSLCEVSKLPADMVHRYVSKWEAAGLIKRTSDPQDGRITLVQPTQEARDFVLTI